MFSKIKSVFVVLTIATLAACGGGGSDVEGITPATGGTTFPPKEVVYTEATVDIVGDSISIGLNNEVSPIMRLAEYRPKWVVEHHSAGGLTVDTMLRGYHEPWPYAHPIYFPMGPQPQFIDVKRNSRYVFVQLGINDALQVVTQEDAERYEAMLGYVIRILLSEKRIPVIAGVVNIGVNPPLRDHFNNVTISWPASTVWYTLGLVKRMVLKGSVMMAFTPINTVQICWQG